MLGSRHWLAWEEMAEGPLNSIRPWEVFLSWPWHEQKHVLAVIYGGQIMHWQIHESIDRSTILATSSHVKCMGVFSTLEAIPNVKGYFQDRTFWTFDVDNATKLSPSMEDYSLKRYSISLLQR